MQLKTDILVVTLSQAGSIERGCGPAGFRGPRGRGGAGAGGGGRGGGGGVVDGVEGGEETRPLFLFYLSLRGEGGQGPEVFPLSHFRGVVLFPLFGGGGSPGPMGSFSASVFVLGSAVV